MRLYVVLPVLIILIFVVNDVYAQSSTSVITSTTNKASYLPGEKVIISGSITTINPDLPVTIIVRNPIGNVYEVGQVTLSNNLFIHDFVLNDDITPGMYSVQIKHSNQTGQLNFMVYGTQIQSINVGDYFIKIRGNNTNLISYKNVSVSTVDSTVTISVDASKISDNSIIQEFQIPKTIIDAPGSSLIVKIDGTIIQCSQSETNSDRILDCEIPSRTKELQFIGTEIIPEFGFIAILILTVGISVTLILSQRIKMM